MSNTYRPSQYASQRGTLVESHIRNQVILAEGPTGTPSGNATVPTDGTSGYQEGALYWKRGGAAGLQLYINEGTATSCAFKPIPSQAIVNSLFVQGFNAGVAAIGLKIASGQFTTVTASDTVVTGLTTVISAVANLDSAPVVGAETLTASIGDQAGTPAAGSILLQTWKTLGGTPAAGTTFSLKANWIAMGQ